MIDIGDQWAMVGRLALAAVLGALIGLEREYRGYPAGIRTMALVCMGSALFGDMSRIYGGDDRIAAQVVTGIGFLGAGLMFREGLSVKGVTTAATIWAAAAVGLAVAIEAYVVAVFCSIFAVIILEMRILTKNIGPDDGEGDKYQPETDREERRDLEARAKSPQGSRRVDQRTSVMTTDTSPEARTRADRYDPQTIEPKWRARWEADDLYRTEDDDPRPKWYALTMLPYPSGDLHIGHWFAMSPSDAAARYRRMTGYNVLFPMGFDAFGLPAENAAIKRGIHPLKWTYENIDYMRNQLKLMGTMFDWSREVITCDPEYYKWTQWWFLQLLKHDLAYKKRAAVWWCPKDQTVLANEQVIDGKCERCDTVVSKRDLEQWFFRITNYADELLEFNDIQWTDQVMTMQRNWIGRSEGAHLDFGLDVPGVDTKDVTVFTTRPDTVFGVTFFVLAPEHPLVDQITTPEQRAAVEAYVAAARKETEIDRMSTEREKTGVFTGAYVTNQFNGEKVPVWIADYVLATYGTGAVMGVPGHDQRDFEFARKYGLPVIPVFQHPDWDGGELEAALHRTAAR